MEVSGNIPVVSMKYLHSGQYEKGSTSYFLSCNVINGFSLAWEVNGSLLREFFPGDLQRILQDSKPSYVVTASLLSFRRGQDGHHSFDSVMSVISSEPLIPFVRCIESSTGKSDTSTNFQEIKENRPAYEQVKNINDVIHLWVVLYNSSIVESKRTRVFLCISTSEFHEWQTNTGQQNGFDNGTIVGSSFDLSGHDRNTLTLQGILLVNSNGRLISVLYVTDDTIDDVRCTAGDDSVHFPNDFSTICLETTTFGKKIHIYILFYCGFHF